MEIRVGDIITASGPYIGSEGYTGRVVEVRPNGVVIDGPEGPDFWPFFVGDTEMVFRQAQEAGR